MIMNLLRKMIQIRCFENKVSELRTQIKGPVHSCVGQEAVSVGVCSALRKEDFIIGNHRSHGHQLAKGADINKLMAEIFWKESGTNKGLGGSMHVSDKSVGGILTTAIVGSGLPVACGVAFASKYLKDDRITCVFFGDGAFSEGSFHESLLLASQWKLPVLFVLENNQVAVTTVSNQSNYYKFAASYGISHGKANGQRVDEVRSLSMDAVNLIKITGMPYLMEVFTYRFKEHQEGKYYDRLKDSGYRDTEELNRYMTHHDPIRLYADQLIKNNELTEQDLDDIYKEEMLIIENAVDEIR